MQYNLSTKESDNSCIFFLNETTTPNMLRNQCRPAIFRTTQPQENAQQLTPGCEEVDSDGEDDLPPLEANLNRNRPVELYSDADSDSDPVS